MGYPIPPKAADGLISPFRLPQLPIELQDRPNEGPSAPLSSDLFLRFIVTYPKIPHWGNWVQSVQNWLAAYHGQNIMGTNIPQPTIEPPLEPRPPLLVLSPGSVIGGFWRRLAAFLLDAFLLGIIGAIIGAAFFDFLVAMGPWAHLLGFCIALCYFGPFDSSIGNGQTIGKRVLRLKVVNAQGGMLSLEDAILRFVVFAGPFFANGLSLPVSRTPWFVSALIGVVVFGAGGTNLYLLVFNRPMRQGLHDLSTKSYVVISESEGPIVSKPFWKAHWTIIATLFVLLGAVATLITIRLLKRGTFPQLMADAALIERIDGVQAAEVRETRVLRFSDNSSAKLLAINIQWTGEADEEKQIAYQVAELILQNDHNIRNYGSLKIAITRSYDLGIASGWASRTFAYSPDEWRARVQ